MAIALESLDERLALLEESLTDGVLQRAAQAIVAEGEFPIDPAQVGFLIQPEPISPEDKDPRWVLAADATSELSEFSKANEDHIIDLADQLGMRKPKSQSLGLKQLGKVNLAETIWVVEGGANKTSIVRRFLAVQGLRHMNDEKQATDEVVYQLGSGTREIPEFRNGQPNKEFEVVQSITGGRKPSGENWTEFEVNVATALESRYVVDDELALESVGRVIVMHRNNTPHLVQIQPNLADGTLRGGLSAVAHAIGLGPDSMNYPARFVIATNGQYRPKDELMATQWAESTGTPMLPPIALGDEAGFKVHFKGEELVTANRSPIVYLKEMAILAKEVEKARS